MDSMLKFLHFYTFTGVISATIALLIPFLYCLYSRNIRRWKFPINKWNSYEFQKGVRCNKTISDGKLVNVLDHRFQGKGAIKTIYECFMHGLEISEDGPCLGHLVDNLTRYEWLSYGQVQNQAESIGKFLRSQGVSRQQGIGISAANGCEWVIVHLACALQSLITVPLYNILPVESIKHSINEVEMPALFCDSEENLAAILADRESFPYLKILVLMHDDIKNPKFGDDCKEQGILFATWSQAKRLGAQHSELQQDPPKPSDLLLIQYTSGTTGRSKGVMITHENMVASIAGCQWWTNLSPTGKTGTPGNSTCCALLSLPLAHVYAQGVVDLFFYLGGKIGFPSGNIQRLFQDAQILKPTFLPLVPRILNRFYTTMLADTKSGFKGWLFWKCYEGKKRLFEAGYFTRNSAYDWLVFGKIQQLLGGRVQTMTTGSAPIAPEVLEFWRVVFGCRILEGYGLTEATSLVSLTIDVHGGNVGHPIPSCLVRLQDLPEFGYTNANNPPQGEICVKGPNVTQGYYKRPEVTKEAFTEDGFVLTGDIGEFLPDGSLRIIDRRKHIFKLSQGEYIAPENVEAVYAQCPLIAQIFVDGNSIENYVIAIVVPEESTAKHWWEKQQKLDNVSVPKICSDQKFRRYILENLIAIGKKNGLNKLEQIRSLYLHPEQMTVENGCLTPTMKNVRVELRRRFKSHIEALYKAGPMI